MRADRISTTTKLMTTLTLLAASFQQHSGVSACRKTMINGHGVTAGDKNVILEHHNRMRQAVAMGQIPGQPGAANMLEMKWDEELAQRAQKWSSSCASETHDSRRHSSRFPVGQNIATMWSHKHPGSAVDMMANFEHAIGEWFNEFKYYRYGPVHNGEAGTTAHYTQMIWAETNLIGCGFSYYFDAAKGFTKKYVCNYGSSGNVLGQPPYIKGRPSCQKFDLISSRKYVGLCEQAPKNSYHDFYSNYIG